MIGGNDITRVSFCEIANQEYAERPKWKKLNGIQRQIIEKYIKRMDEATYTELKRRNSG